MTMRSVVTRLSIDRLRLRHRVLGVAKLLADALRRRQLLGRTIKVYVCVCGHTHTHSLIHQQPESMSLGHCQPWTASLNL